MSIFHRRRLRLEAAAKAAAEAKPVEEKVQPPKVEPEKAQLKEDDPQPKKKIRKSKDEDWITLHGLLPSR